MPDDPASLVDAGIEAERENNSEVALAYYSKALDIDPDNLAASINLSYLLLQRECFDKALEIINHCLETHPDNISLKNNLTTYFILQRDFVIARKIADEVLEKDQKS